MGLSFLLGWAVAFLRCFFLSSFLNDLMCSERLPALASWSQSMPGQVAPSWEAGLKMFKNEATLGQDNSPRKGEHEQEEQVSVEGPQQKPSRGSPAPPAPA